MSTYEHMVGRHYRTPFEPSGIVKVLEVEFSEWSGEIYARVEHVGEHPMGYPDGSMGRYYAKELREIVEEA